MKCPYCSNHIHEDWETADISKADEETKRGWMVNYMMCPSCENDIVIYSEGTATWSTSEPFGSWELLEETAYFVKPRHTYNTPLPIEVPTFIKEDFEEAILVLPYSAKASAALSRRCLQNILKEASGVTKKDLIDQISEATKKDGLTASLRKLLEAVRNVGNYAAHPMKDKASGVIIDVEPGEAELNIATLEQLIDFYYIRPAEEKSKLDAINKKLAALGKSIIS